MAEQTMTGPRRVLDERRARGEAAWLAGAPRQREPG